MQITPEIFFKKGIVFRRNLSRFFGRDEMHNLRPLYGRPYHGGGYAHSESAVLLCNTWDLVVSEGSGDASLVIGSWVLMIDDLRPL